MDAIKQLKTSMERFCFDWGYFTPLPFWFLFDLRHDWTLSWHGQTLTKAKTGRSEIAKKKVETSWMKKQSHAFQLLKHFRRCSGSKKKVSLSAKEYWNISYHIQGWIGMLHPEFFVISFLENMEGINHQLDVSFNQIVGSVAKRTLLEQLQTNIYNNSKACAPNSTLLRIKTNLFLPSSSYQQTSWSLC